MPLRRLRAPRPNRRGRKVLRKLQRKIGWRMGALIKSRKRRNNLIQRRLESILRIILTSKSCHYREVATMRIKALLSL